MKLSEFLKKSSEPSDYITLNKIEKMFQKISSNHDNVIYTNLTYNNDFNFSEKIVLSSNPDCDFPRIKKEILSFQDNKYNENDQKILDNISYKDKIDCSYLNKLNNNIIYCHAVGYEHKNINMIPIGRDFKNERYFSVIDRFSKNKNILCYCNFTLPPNKIHWYGLVRKHVYDYYEYKSFVLKEHCHRHPRNYNNQIVINYYKKLASSKFNICPRGCGIDSYRIWDSIHMGCIPIVEKYEGYNQFEDLPILFVDHWKDYEKLTEDYLESKWEEMLEKEYNYEKLNMSYWEKKIIRDIETFK